MVLLDVSFLFYLFLNMGPQIRASTALIKSHIMLTYAWHRNLPIGALVLVVLSIFLKFKGAESENRKLSLKLKLDSMDPLGCFVFIGAVCCLLLALQWGGQSKPWSSSTVIGLIVGFVALFGLFGYLQWRRQDRALIPPRVLRRRSIFTGAMVLFFLGASTYLVGTPLSLLISS